MTAREPSSASQPLLAGEDLHTYYGQSHILRGVTIAIRPGETIGLMGRNGMGKTTLIRTLMGLVKPRSGTVSIDGAAANSLATYQRAQAGIAYVPEGRGIFASLSVAENLAIACRDGVNKKPAWTVPRVLELFPRLGQRLGNRGDQLSGGEQQMLAIARALVINPKLLLLDEPMEGLAPIVVHELGEVLRALVRAGAMAIVLVEQHAELALALTQRAIVMERGRIVHEGTSDALLADRASLERWLAVS